MKLLIVAAFLLTLSGCGGDFSVSCVGNDKEGIDCKSVPKRPSSNEKVVVSIDALGICRVSGDEVACDAVGSELRKRFPDVNPEVRLCPDRQAKYEKTSIVMSSVAAAEFSMMGFGSSTRDCGPGKQSP